MTEFITLLAWIFGVVFTIAFGLSMWSIGNYDEVAQLRDLANGRIRVFHAYRYFIVAVICWAWIITH